MTRAFFGWKVVVVAFAVATFAWGLGFYGPGVYLVELHRRHGWPISMISFAITAYYVVSAVLVAAVGDLFERFGPRRVVLVSVAALGIGVLAIAEAQRPWHLYVAFAVMTVGWAGTSTAAVSAMVAPWFERRRGLAVSLALNGASSGGVLLVPLWTLLIAAVGFGSAALAMVGAMVGLLVPLVVLVLHRGPQALGLLPDGATADAPVRATLDAIAPLDRRRLLLSPPFWTITAPFALGLLAQVGFLTHQLAFLGPLLGAQNAALAVSVTTAAAIVGRVATGFIVDRVDRRLASAANLGFQIVALTAMLGQPSVGRLYAGCVLFGLGVGNMITVPSLIVQVEYPREHFNRVVSLVLAITQGALAFGPGLLGWIRDHWESYSAAWVVCIACDAVAMAVLLLGRPRRG